MESKLRSIYELRLKVRKFEVEKTRGTVMFTVLVVITRDGLFRSCMLILKAAGMNGRWVDDSTTNRTLASREKEGVWKRIMDVPLEPSGFR